MVQPAQMCQRHQRRLVDAAKLGPEDPWRSLVIVAQIVLFQSATANDATYTRLNADITKIASLGCLACYNPEAFGEVEQAAKANDLGALKALGERWLREAADRGKETQGS